MVPFFERQIPGNPEDQVVNVPWADGAVGLIEFPLNCAAAGEHVDLATAATSLLCLLRDAGVNSAGFHRPAEGLCA